MTLKERWASNNIKDNLIFLDFVITIFVGIGIGVGSSDVIIGFTAFIAIFLIGGDFQKTLTKALTFVLGTILSYMLIMWIYDVFSWWIMLGAGIGFLIGFITGVLLLVFKNTKRSENKVAS